MAQEIDFSDAEIKALDACLGQTTSAMAAQIAAETGHTLNIDISSVALKEEADIRALVPADAMSWGIAVAETEGQFLFVCGKESALALSRPAEDDEDAFKERLADKGPFSDQEKTTLGQVQEKLAAGLIEAMAPHCSRDLAPAGFDFLSMSAWVSGEDPLGSDPRLVAEMSVTVGNTAATPGFIVISPDLIKSCFAGALTLETDSTPEDGTVSNSGDFIFYPASSAMKEKILEQLGTTPKDCETIAELMRGFVDDSTQGAVIGVSQGDEHILSLLRGMQELPDCQDKPIIIVLESATTANVVRCGRLGLFDVLPVEFGEADFQDRLLP